MGTASLCTTLPLCLAPASLRWPQEAAEEPPPVVRCSLMGTAQPSFEHRGPLSAEPTPQVSGSNRPRLGSECGMTFAEDARMLHDIRFAVRVLLKGRTFTLAAVLCLGLGIGANTAILSVLNAVVFRSLAFEDPDRIVVLRDVMADGYDPRLAPADYLELREWSLSFEELAGHAPFDVNLAGTAAPERIRAETVSPSFFDVFRVTPALGRAFVSDRDTADVHEVVLSYRSWQGRFGADPGILGRTLFLDGRPHAVVGVAGASFTYPETAEMWLRSYRYGVPEPPVTIGDDLNQVRGAGYFRVVGRLAGGVTLGQAQAEMDVIFHRFAEAGMGDSARIGMQVQSIHEDLVGDIRPALFLLLGAVGFLLLIGCANVANLQLARSAARQREIAIRAALGASRSRLVTQLLVEALLLGLAGGSLGLLLGSWGVDALRRLAPGGVARISEAGLDGRVLAFVLGVSVVAAIVFGLAPALSASKLDLQTALKEGGRSASDGLKSRRFQGMLVVSELALSLILLSGGGLLIRSLLKLQAKEPGFDPASLLVMRIDLPDTKYADPRGRAAFFAQVIEGISRAPGVVSAGAILSLPFTGHSYVAIWEVVGRPRPDGQRHVTGFQVATPDYFRTMGIPLLRGRMFAETDDGQAPPVVLVNASAAQRLWPDEDPVGKRVTAVSEVEVVGVVGDVRHLGYGDPPRPEVYLPHRQESLGGMALVVRAGSDPRQILGTVRAQVAAVDAEQTVFDVHTMDEVMAGSVQRRRFTAQLLGLFSAAAVVLALIGIYGVMAYTVSQRTPEIAVRVALGARRSEVLRLALWWGLKWVLAGHAVGLVMGLGLTGFIASHLFEVSATDPAVLAGVCVLLTASGTLAAYLPAQRASRIDPVTSLKYE